MQYTGIIETDLIIKKGDDISLVTEIKGNFTIESGEHKSANLQSIGGYVDVRTNAKLTIPVCQSIGGYVNVRTNAELTIPENCKKNDPSNTAQGVTKEFNFNCFLELGFLFADGILAKILSVKNNTIFKIQICGKTEVSYCIKKGNTFAHGDTIKQARESFIYKISDRDTTKYKGLTLDTVLTKNEAIQMYRTITGACERGTRYFVESLSNCPEKATIKEIIELTNGQFGSNSLVEFFGG